MHGDGCLRRLLFRAVGIEAPEDRVEALLKELDGKDIADVVASGLSKLASVPSGGAVAAAAPAAGNRPRLPTSAILL